MASTSSCTRGRHPRLDRVNVAIAFGAGILSFLSPCVLPLVPAFLVDMAGEAALSGTQRARALGAAERGFTGHVDEKGRDERKHAGGQKREDPGTEGDRDVHPI